MSDEIRMTLLHHSTNDLIEELLMWRGLAAEHLDRIAELEEENDRLQAAWFEDETICPDGSLKPKVSTLLENRFADTEACNGRLVEQVEQLTAENKRLKAVLNEWDMAWLNDCIAPQPNGNEAFGLDEGLVLCARMMKPILEETRLLLGKAEVVR